MHWHSQYLRDDPGALARIEGIVYQFLNQGQRPQTPLKANLHLKFFFAEKLQFGLS
jgi:hypothetical protein